MTPTNTQTHERAAKIAEVIRRRVQPSYDGTLLFVDQAALEIAASLFPESGGQAEGWKLVPVEPTKAMTDAWWRTHFADVTVQDISDAAAYKAMLAAAPSVTPHKGGGDGQ